MIFGRDSGCQPRKTQERVDVGRRNTLRSSDVMHGEFGVLDKTCVNIMSVSAGAVVTARLSEDPATRVLLGK
jgi:hypothetical protein